MKGRVIECTKKERNTIKRCKSAVGGHLYSLSKSPESETTTVPVALSWSKEEVMLEDIVEVILSNLCGFSTNVL